MARTFLLIFLSSCIFCSAQIQKENAATTLRGSFGIPATLSSSMFKTSFNGVVEANLNINFKVKKNFFAGLGYQFSYLQNNKQVFVFYKAQQGSLSYNTNIMAHSAMIRAGYDRFFSSIGYMSYALNIGYMFAQYQNIIPDTSAANKPFGSPRFNSPYIQPEISINFMAEESLSFSVFLGYCTVLSKFDPKAPRFSHIEQVKETSNNYYMSWLTFGFGFTVLFNGKK